MENKRRIRVITKKSENKKRKRVNGRGGAPALMHRPAAVEAEPCPEKRGECANTASRPYSLLLQAHRYPEARDPRLNKVRVLFKQRNHLLQEIISEYTAARGTAPWATGLAVVMEAVLTGISGMLFVCFLLSVVCGLAVYSTGRW